LISITTRKIGITNEKLPADLYMSRKCHYQRILTANLLTEKFTGKLSVVKIRQSKSAEEILATIQYIYQS